MSDAGDFPGGSIHHVADYHDQIVFHDSVVAEGHVLDLRVDERGAFVVYARVNGHRCGEGDKLVMETEPSVLRLDERGMRVVPSRDYAGLDIRKAATELQRMQERLPMLFDADGCVPERSHD